MKYLVNTEQMKAAEKLCSVRHISYQQMMCNAGNAIADRIAKTTQWCETVILCGAGNNGGDGFVIAKNLSERLFSVKVILLCKKPKTDCAAEYFAQLPSDMIMDYEQQKDECDAAIRNAKLVVDCVFGTGFHGTLPQEIIDAFAIANNAKYRISADVPSGVNSDDGSIAQGCFRPQKTYVLAALKKCCTVPSGREVHGDIELLDIGITDDCFEEYTGVLSDKSFLKCLAKRSHTCHKGNFGRLLNIAGSFFYCGAAAMSTCAALRSGVGLCTLAAPIDVVKALCGSIHESTYLPLPETADGFSDYTEAAEKSIAELLPKMTAVSIGCGMGNNENTRRYAEYVIKNAACPVIIDADGINSISDNINVLRERTGTTILTPHPLEFGRMCDLKTSEIQSDRIGTAKRFAKEYGVILVLKGSETITTDGESVIVNTSGNPALAKGGSGDVLCGIIAALAAQGQNPLYAAASGVYVHGVCADIAAGEMEQACVLASDIIARLPQVLKQQNDNDDDDDCIAKLLENGFVS